MHVSVVTAAPQDVRTIDGMIAAFYATISGPKGAARDWARDRTLYVRDVRFVAMAERDGNPVATIYTHQDYVDAVDSAMVTNGFFEQEIGRRTQRFGNIAHVASAYAMRQAPNDQVIGRGVNHVQLYWDGMRWWITGVAWDGERPGNPIPKELVAARE